MAKPIEVDDATFQSQVLESDIPVLVDFWAEWCGPCKMIAPLVEELAEEYDGRVKFAKVDVDTAQALAQQFSVMAIPTLLIFKNGAPADQIVGAVPKAELKKRLDSSIA
jgi:thioredoxin 1